MHISADFFLISAIWRPLIGEISNILVQIIVEFKYSKTTLTKNKIYILQKYTFICDVIDVSTAVEKEEEQQNTRYFKNN